MLIRTAGTVIRAVGGTAHQLVKVHDALGPIGDGIEVHVVAAGTAAGHCHVLLRTALGDVVIECRRIAYTHRDRGGGGPERILRVAEIVTHIVGLQLADPQGHGIDRGTRFVVLDGYKVVAAIDNGHPTVLFAPENRLGRRLGVHSATQFDLIA